MKTAKTKTDATSGAVIEGDFRYHLWRQWDPAAKARRLLWVMLNPSTADASANDPTIGRCITFAKAWGFGRIDVVNLFAYRATDPQVLVRLGVHGNADVIGPKNDNFISSAAVGADMVVAAWGTQPIAKARAKQVLALHGMSAVVCLGTTKDGSPRHPLYVRASQPLVPYVGLI